MRLTALLLLAAALVGCDAPMTAQRAEENRVDSATTAPLANDNTAINERERHTVLKTPLDQANNQADIDITAQIRKQIMAQDDFSLNAQNVKIMTEAGHVTLRGPVTTAAERDSIDKIAKEVAGSDKVDNQLDVAP